MTTLVTLPFVASAAALAGAFVGFRTVVPVIAVTFVAAAAWVLA